eukprot:c14756_g1_i2.p1 GENE.c14756_g1_i2~~c14756_g1_i2.p1  ORF type:complete len:399 (+),score=99.92 c14756_g1_i2:63-1259(+)
MNGGLQILLKNMESARDALNKYLQEHQSTSAEQSKTATPNLSPDLSMSRERTQELTLLESPKANPDLAAAGEKGTGALAGGLRVVVRSKIHDQWFVDRVHPEIAIEIVDEVTGELAACVTDWKIDVQVLTQSETELQRGFTTRPIAPVIKGRGTIAGLKYLRVSSKSGGNFSLVIRVVAPNNQAAQTASVAPFVSRPVQVLSYRLYQAPKLSADKLQASDCVSRMLGIGTLYAKRFAAVNVRTVADLAALDLDALSKAEQWNLLSTLRKNRGDMTITRLQSHVNQAREIVERGARSPPAVESPASSVSSSENVSSSSSPKLPQLAVMQTIANAAALSANALLLSTTARSAPCEPSPSSAVVVPMSCDNNGGKTCRKRKEEHGSPSSAAKRLCIRNLLC